MLSSDFQKNLKKLNKNLRIIPNPNDSFPAGLYLHYMDELVHICGVDSNFVPEMTEADSKGHIVKAGWRRTLNILIGKGLIDKYQAQRVFKTEIKRGFKKITVEQDDAHRALADITKRRMEQRDGAVMDKDGNVVPVFRRQDFMDWKEFKDGIRS